MINLIPPSAKKAIIREYYIRAVTVWMALVLAALCIVAVLCLPAYVLVQLQETNVTSSFAKMQEDSGAFLEASNVIEETNKTARSLDEVYSIQPLLPVIAHIQSLAPSGIIFDEIVISRAKDHSVETVTVSGEAATRESLASYRDALRSDEKFSDVTLPLSNLAKNEEVPFTIKMGYVVSDNE